MEGLSTQQVMCPYCGEFFEAVIDNSQSETEYTEDCYVCCQPIIFSTHWTNTTDISVHTRREDD